MTGSLGSGQGGGLVKNVWEGGKLIAQTEPGNIHKHPPFASPVSWHLALELSLCNQKAGRCVCISLQ